MLAQSLCHLPLTSAFWRPRNPLSKAKSWVSFAWGGGMRPEQEGEKYRSASAGMGDDFRTHKRSAT